MKDDLFNETVDVRYDFWKKIGKIDPDVLTHLINPAFRGGPRWPALRQAFVKIETPNSVIWASDGLSDPFDDVEEPNQGFSLECYLESDDPALRKNIAELDQTWQFQLLYEVAQNFAHHGGVKELLEHHGVLSMEFSYIDVPEPFSDEEGRVGVLLGLESEQIPTSIIGPASDIRLVSIKILTSQELQYILQHGAAGRKKLAELFREQGSHHLSTLNRNPVV
ncbi:Suppressor of fused protein (SUFU) [Laceyella tengchongensis]|uniref:Suppressor of fused protein (SUFU) n=1 Tax=Laceyella tengchongensis TaxID=574699 RepID=A0AA45WSA4_9BACL|nr:suppressor of fused domain protein [Laceyella tengchongensis]SMP35941.1 Suppressor of fused protein (SUFU) [Laceyella tengchongensis]